MAGILYLLLTASALLAGIGAVLSIPDLMLQATIGPTAFTVMMLAGGTALLVSQERGLLGTSGLSLRRIQTLEDRPATPVAPTILNYTNEPKNVGDRGGLLAAESIASATAPGPEAPVAAVASTPAGAPDPVQMRPIEGAKPSGVSRFRPLGGRRLRPGRAVPKAVMAEVPPPSRPIGQPAHVQSATAPTVLGIAGDLLDTPESREQAVTQAIEDDALTAALIPVVSLPQRRRRMVQLQLECRHFGKLADPFAMLGEKGGSLRAALDFELIRAAVAAADQPRPGSENLPVMAVIDLKSFDGATAVGALERQVGQRKPGATPLQLILTEWPDDRQGEDMLLVLRRADVKVGLELRKLPFLSPDAILRRGPALVCMPASELRNAALSAYDADLIRDIKTIQASGVEIMVTGIGDERMLVEVLDYPVHLGTGRLFGRIG